MMMRLNRVYIILAIGCFLFLAIFGALRESLTYDEIVHMEEGVNAWVHHTFKVDVVNPPLIKEIAVLPIILGLAPVDGVPPNLAVFPVRLTIIFWGVILMVWVSIALRKALVGGVGTVAIFLMAFEPNILAHSHYVTLDFGYTVVFFIVYTYFVFFVLHEKNKRLQIVPFGILLGTALASKVSALLMIPVSYTLSTLVLHGKEALSFFWLRKGALAGAAIITLFFLWATYFFQWDTVIAPGGDETRVSKRLYEKAERTNNKILMQAVTAAETVKIPLGTYAAMVKNSFIYGRQQGSNIFFLGTYRESKEWYYDVTVLFLKTPIPLLFLVFFSTAYYLLSKQRKILFLMWIPVIVTLLVSYIGKVQPAVRYMLPLFPFLCVIAAMGIPYLYQRYKFLVIILGLWYVVGTLSQFPHFISYANEFAGEPDKRYELFSDSNLDWGQGLITLRDYVKEKDPASLRLSYFGRDNAEAYGFTSTVPYGSYKANEICAFHPVEWGGEGRALTIISVTNWYECGYKDGNFAASGITDVVANSFLVFNQ